MECLKLGGAQGKWVGKQLCQYFWSSGDCLFSAVGWENCLTKQRMSVQWLTLWSFCVQLNLGLMKWVTTSEVRLHFMYMNVYVVRQIEIQVKIISSYCCLILNFIGLRDKGISFQPEFHFDVQYIHGVLLTCFNLFPFSFIQSWVYFEHHKRNRQLFPRDVSLSQYQVCVPFYNYIITLMCLQFLDLIEFCLETLCTTLTGHSMSH